MNYPNSRLRRLRYNPNVRRLVEDIDLKTSDLIYPIFVCEGENVKEEIASLAGQYRYCLLYTSPSPRDTSSSRMPSSA